MATTKEKDSKTSKTVIGSIMSDNSFTADRYVIKGNNVSRHKFRHMPVSEHARELEVMAQDGRLAAACPRSNDPEPFLKYSKKTYEQSVIGQCDRNGMVDTVNKEHAKLIFKEYRTMDPKCVIHEMSKKFDPEEEVDMDIAMLPRGEVPSSSSSLDKRKAS